MSALSAGLRISQSVIRLREEDPDLAEKTRAEECALATRVLVVGVATAEPSEWEPPAPDTSSPALLVLDGLLVGRLQLGVMPSAELLGPGDVLRPWEEGLAPDVLPALSHAKVLQPARLALLDRRANTVIGGGRAQRGDGVASEARRRGARGLDGPWIALGTAIGVNLRDLTDLSNTVARQERGGLSAQVARPASRRAA